MAKLSIYTYVDGVNDTPFYDAEHPIEMSRYDVSIELMGTFSITGKVWYPECLDNHWTGMQYVMFRGERYFIKNKPSSEYSSGSVMYEHTLDFISEKDTVLGGKYFLDAVQGSSNIDSYRSNSTDVTFYGDLNEFVARLNAAASYMGMEYSFVVDSGVTTEAQMVSFTDKYILDAMKESYDIFKVPFYFVGKVCHFGHTNNVLSPVFKYGSEDALVKISKLNSGKKAIRSATGVGSSDNIPDYYPNISPKGDLEAVAGSSNVTLKQKDIRIVNYERYANGVPENVSVRYHAAAVVESSTLYRFMPGREEGEYVEYGGEGDYIAISDNMLTDRFRIDFVVTGRGQLRVDPLFLFMPTKLPPYERRNAIEEGALTAFSLWNVTDDFAMTLMKSGGSLVADNVMGGKTYRMELTYDITVIKKLAYASYCMSYELTPKSFWAIDTEDEMRTVDLSDIGIRIGITPSDYDYFTQVVGEKITPATTLMPAIYRDSKGKERFLHAANNTYKKPGAGNNYYEFENEYSQIIPGEGKITRDDIKPTIKGTTNYNGEEIGQFLAVAFDVTDNDEQDENGNFLHPYFFVKIPRFDGADGFNLFDAAIESGPMTFAMESGPCGGCKFQVGVDSKTGKNIVQVDNVGALKRDSEGNVLWRGQEPQDRQNNTEEYEVWLALKKDVSTYGVVMPNATNYYKPKEGDRFSILNIRLPEMFIISAELRLHYAILDYMEENNPDRFDFSVDFSRIYLVQNPDTESQIRENTMLHVQYNGTIYRLWVLSYSYSVKEDSPLPEVKVTVTKEVASKTSFRSRYPTNGDVDNMIRQYVSRMQPGSFAGSNSIFGSAISAERVEMPLLIKVKDTVTEYNGSEAVEIDLSNVAGGGENFVTLSTDQTITGKKTFANDVIFGGAVSEGVFGRLLIPSTAGPGIYGLLVSDEPVSGETPSGSGGLDKAELWLELGGSTDNPVIGKAHLPGDTVYTDDLAGYALKSELPDLTPYATWEWVTGQGYATQTWVKGLGYLTATDADEKYVNIAGDTMTGPLHGTNIELSGHISASTLYVPYSGGNKVYSLKVGDGPVSGEAPSGSGGLDSAALWEELGGNATDKVIGLSRIPDIPVDMVSGLLGGDSRILPSLLPDWLMGQLLYGGTVDGSSVATVSAAFKDRYGTGGDTVTLNASNASQYEGVYFIASADASSGVVQSLGVRTGDWVVSNGIEWTKIDNTDSVSSVAGLTGIIGKAALQTALSDSTHRFVTDAQIASWDAKWAWNADEIKAVKVDAAVLADKAKALNAARSLWGQSFDGTGDVDGDMSGVGGITMSGSIAGAVNADFSGYLSAGTLYVPYSGGNKVYSLKVSDAPVSGEAPSVGGGMDTDALWLELGGSTDDKVIAKSHLPEDTVYEGDLAGYALKSEIPSLAGYATQSWVQSQGYLKSVSLATISDLHSSWDAVLKAQKPAWLTAVSLATISDLHSSWDALLKAAPTKYVTRWPTASEVGALTQTAADDRYLRLTGGTLTGMLKGTDIELSGHISASVLYVPSTSGNKVYSLKVSDSPVSGEAPSAGGGGLDVDAMWDELEASDASRVIDASHIPLLDMDKVSGLPTALSVVNASLNAMSEALQDKADISDIPSLSGYVSSVTTSGAGNAVTGFSKSGNTLTLVKGTTFLTSVPKATSSAYGGVKIGYPESGKNYPVELDSSGRAYVSVPWVNTTYSLSSFGITATAAEINKLDGIGTLLHSGNIGSYALTPSNYASTLDSRYVKKAGDTMTGPLTITTSADDILVFNDTASEKYFRIKAKANGTDWGGLVLDGRSSIPNLYLGVTTSDYKVWHSGNDGRGSGLDADLLDGYQASSFLLKSGGTMTGNLTLKSMGGTWLGGKTQAPIMTSGESSTSGNTYHPVIWGKTDAGDVWNLGHGASDQVGFFGFYSERTVNGTDWAHYIKVSDGTVHFNKTVYCTTFSGTLSGNATSATKLQTSRTLWGRPFDGTGNVSGDMSGVGGITASGNLSIAGRSSFSGIISMNGYEATGASNFNVAARTYNSNHSSIEICGGNYVMGLGCHSDGLWYWWRGTSGNASSSGKSYVMQYNGSTWNFTGGITASGNVGIGTTSPAYKLDVAGEIRATSGITIGSTDDYGWYISTGTRISAGIDVARGVNVGSLLVSNAWADYTKVPTNGIYSKGNILSAGNIIAYSSSSRLVKDILPKRTTFSQRLTALGSVVDYRYNNVLKRDKDAHIGLIYENVRDTMPGMCHTHEGYGALNYLNTDYINLIAGSVQEHTDEIAHLKNKVASLEAEVARLRRGLAA